MFIHVSIFIKPIHPLSLSLDLISPSSNPFPYYHFLGGPPITTLATATPSLEFDPELGVQF
ncbi:hypothetical protein HYC85_017441 [Camellia sinensis]|uniref:Uncharacterized protein n=1 Tax=Camellia sinensis TaxID=4442 RepID=A0A7J7GVA0_CAMSI|nr:hypothetical protein HYC85_017441 [Camellia sinensis]